MIEVQEGMLVAVDKSVVLNQSSSCNSVFPFSVQKLSEFLSSDEIEEHDKCPELRSADAQSKYQAVVSNNV